MHRYCIPLSGRLLITQLAGYGLATIADSPSAPSYLYHASGSLELDVMVETNLDAAGIAERVRRSAAECEATVEADVEPGLTGNNRIPVIRARATDADRAEATLVLRERLLDELEAGQMWLPMALVAGLGAPGSWLGPSRPGAKPRPQDGATRLDGVAMNIGSDIVRGALRPARYVAADCAEDTFAVDFSATGDRDFAEAADRFNWSPPGTPSHPIIQWLAALGLSLLPVGLVADGLSRTPGAWRQQGPSRRGITLPVFDGPVSVARLRAVLQTASLASRVPDARAAAQLKAHGVAAVAAFSVRDSSNDKMVQFSFDSAERCDL
jgi:hypothetical protein